jgi:hypothetical protein
MFSTLDFIWVEGMVGNINKLVAYCGDMFAHEPNAIKLYVLVWWYLWRLWIFDNFHTPVSSYLHQVAVFRL